MSEDTKNHVNEAQETTSQVTSISYSFVKEDGTEIKTNRSIMESRLYIPGYRVVDEGGEKKFSRIENDLWAAKIAKSKGETAVDPLRENIDQEYANQILTSGIMDTQVAFDDYAKRFYVTPLADLTEIQKLGIALNSGTKLISNELDNLAKLEAQGKVTNIATKVSRRKDYSTELAEGATKITLSKGDDDFTMHYVNNRNYLTVSGDRTGPEKDKVINELVAKFDKVKRDSFAGKQPYIDYSATDEERKAILNSDPDIFSTRGVKAAEFRLSYAKGSANYSQVSSESVSGAEYTEMRQSFVKKHELARKMEEQASKEASPLEKEQLDQSNNGPQIPEGELKPVPKSVDIIEGELVDKEAQESLANAMGADENPMESAGKLTSIVSRKR